MDATEARLMPDDTTPRIGNGGETFSPYSIRSRMAQETQERIDMIMRRESELEAFDADAVKELSKHVI